jgi:hypothetical protein
VQHRPPPPQTQPERYNRQQQRQLWQQRQRQYNNRWSNWQAIQAQRQRQLQQQRRQAYLRYQQRYWEQIRRDQIRLAQMRYYDNLIYNHRYYRGGQYYYTSQYGAQMLQDALERGYEEGYWAGRADRDDGWGYDYRNSYGYQDATFGYDGYYVPTDEYSHYFREGFRRGYEDGYYSRNDYGYYDNGRPSILGAIIGTIIDIVRF